MIKKAEWEIALDKFNKDKGDEPVFITTELTPYDAEALLSDNEHNRYSVDRLVGRYLKFMENNEWGLNGETIKISKTGMLLDGQHRLKALIQYDKPIRFAIAIGVKESLFAVTDTGKSRNAGDILRMAGYQNVFQNAAALNVLAKYQASESFSVHLDHAPDDVLKYMHRWEHMAYFAKPATQFKAIMNITAIQFMMYVTQSFDSEKSYEFFAKLQTGEKLGKTSPILHLRNMHQTIKSKNLFMDKRHIWASLFLAWNAYMEKQRVSTVKWDGKEFPMLIGVDRDMLFKPGSGFGKNEPVTN